MTKTDVGKPDADATERGTESAPTVAPEKRTVRPPKYLPKPTPR